MMRSSLVLHWDSGFIGTIGSTDGFDSFPNSVNILATPPVLGSLSPGGRGLG